MATDYGSPQRRVQGASTERGRRTREAIIDAAATIMYENGVVATSLDDVLAASGTGKSQLYHYFSCKSDLVAAVVECQLERVLAAQPGLAEVDSMTGIERWARAVLRALGAGSIACASTAWRPVLLSAWLHCRGIEE